MPIILEIDAMGMFQQTKRARSIKEMLKIPRLARLFVAYMLLYSTPNTVRYYHVCSDEVDEKTVREGGMIGDSVIQLVSQIAIAEDTATVQKQMHDLGIYVSITIIADNIVIAGSVEDVIRTAHAFDTLEDGHYMFDDKKFMRTFELPLHMHDDDDLRDETMPGNGMLKQRLQKVYKRILPEKDRAGWDTATVETHAMKHLGIPVGTDRGVFKMLGVRAAEFENTCKFLANIHNANPADIDALVMGSLDAQVQHIVAAVPTRLTEDFTRRIDEAVVGLYTTLYNRASAGFSSEPTDIRLSPQQKAMLFLKADRITAGKGLRSMSQLRESHVYTATIKGVIFMAKKKRLPMKAMILQHIGRTMLDQIQTALTAVHKRTTDTNKARIAAKVPENATDFLKSRTPATETAKIMSILQQTDRARRFNAGAVRYKDGGQLLRLYEAQSARLEGYGAEKPLKNARSRRLTTVTRQGWIVTFATMLGLPVPGFQHLAGMTCNCRGEHAEVDIDHVFACSKNGRAHIHRAVNHALGTAIAMFGGDVATFQRFEPRGKDFFQTGGGKGPDLEATVAGVSTFVDVSAVADSSKTRRKEFHAARVAAGQHKIQLVPTRQQRKESPLDKRDRVKTDGECATLARENGALFVPGTFMHNGGISTVFRTFIVKCFKRVRAQHPFEFGQDITTAVEFATQMISTAIVNAVGTYVVRNMKHLFKANGRGDEVLQWWHGDTDAKNEWSDPAVQLTLDMEGGSQDTLECVLPAPAVENSVAAALAQMSDDGSDVQQPDGDEDDRDTDAQDERQTTADTVAGHRTDDDDDGDGNDIHGNAGGQGNHDRSDTDDQADWLSLPYNRDMSCCQPLPRAGARADRTGGRDSDDAAPTAATFTDVSSRFGRQDMAAQHTTADAGYGEDPASASDDGRSSGGRRPEDDGEQADSEDVEEIREDEGFRYLSEHFSAQARRK